MKQFLHNLFFALLSSFFIAGSGFAQTPASPSPDPALTAEARGVWIHLSNFSNDPAVGKTQIREWVNKIADANVNFVLPWVVSDYIAPILDEKATNAAAVPAWNSLGELIEASSARGLQVHVWYSFTYYKSPGSPEFAPKFGGHPEWAALRLSDWQAARATPAKHPMTDVCPMHPEARVWQLNLIERMLERFPAIAGIHIEEPGFGYPGNCVCDLCRSLFKQIHGSELTDSLDTAQAEDFRCIGTTEFIRELRQRLSQRKIKPVFSVNGGSNWRGDRSLGRDWRRWAELGWLDYYASQNYTPDPGQFRKLTSGIISDLPGCPVFVGIGIKWSGGATPLDAALQEVQIAREQGARGVIFFSAAAMTDEHWQALKAGPFKTPADFPLKKE